MIIWNQFCYFAFLCFVDPRSCPALDRNETCLFYSNFVPNYESAVLKVSERVMDMERRRNCFAHKHLHTFLAHSTEIDGEPRFFYFPHYDVDAKHIIIVDQVHPIKRFCFTMKRMEAYSLTVIRTKISANIPWDWLDCFHFQEARFENVTISIHQKGYFDSFLLNEHINAIFFYNGHGLDPWNEINYQNAINLYQITINGYSIVTLRNRDKTEIFPSLQMLDLQNNQIEFLSPESFPLMPEIKKINLANNRLKTFNGLSALSVEMLDLNGNPLETSHEMCKFLKTKTSVQFEEKDEICPDPYDLQLESPGAVNSPTQEPDNQVSSEDLQDLRKFPEISRPHESF